MVHKLLIGPSYLHGVRHLVHRDIKPADLLINLKGGPKITDFGLSARLDNTVVMCATFIRTVTYMSPKMIHNGSYSYPADIWSLGLSIFECGTGEFSYSSSEGPVNLMLQILDDPSPSLPKNKFSPKFCSFIDDCLQKDADARPTADQLLAHSFIKKYENDSVDLMVYVRGIFYPTQRSKHLADVCYELWHYTKTLYNKGLHEIFTSLSSIRKTTLAGSRPNEKLVHVFEKLQCRVYGKDGVCVRLSGSFIIGNHFLICGMAFKQKACPIFRTLGLILVVRDREHFKSNSSWKQETPLSALSLPSKSCI